MQKQLFTIVLQNSSQKSHKINRKIFGAASSFSSRNATHNENDDDQTVSGGSIFALANANKYQMTDGLHCRNNSSCTASLFVNFLFAGTNRVIPEKIPRERLKTWNFRGI